MSKNVPGYKERACIVVAADGSGDFTAVQAAIDAIPAHNPERVTVMVRNGIYEEKLFIEHRKISLVGESAEHTVIRYADYALKQDEHGELYHTFNSYTVFIGADDFIAEHITFENNAGRGDVVGQAVAAYVDGDRAVFRRCRFIGRQDTLFTGPLPEIPFDRPTFGGPREGQPRRSSRQYYEECYIEGDIDFIFGSATAVFKRCEIFSRNRLSVEHMDAGDKPVNGWITAPSTPEAAAFGYVFIECRLTGDAPPHSVYLGRPWRSHAKAAFIRCWMGEHIKEEGWHNWNKPDSERLSRFIEYDNRGPGADIGGRRVSWSRQLVKREAEGLTCLDILAGEDGWNPEAGVS